MLYLFILFLFVFFFLYLSIYIDLIFLFGFTAVIIAFFCILVRNYNMKIINLLAADNKKVTSSNETADEHPIIKSARSRLEK